MYVYMHACGHSPQLHAYSSPNSRNSWSYSTREGTYRSTDWIPLVSIIVQHLRSCITVCCRDQSAQSKARALINWHCTVECRIAESSPDSRENNFQTLLIRSFFKNRSGQMRRFLRAYDNLPSPCREHTSSLPSPPHLVELWLEYTAGTSHNVPMS